MREPMIRTIMKDDGSITMTDQPIYSDSDYTCWQFKESKDLQDYFSQYFGAEITEEAMEEYAYQYYYDESEDHMRNDWNSSDIEKAFKAGMMLMKRIMENK